MLEDTQRLHVRSGPSKYSVMVLYDTRIGKTVAACATIPSLDMMVNPKAVVVDLLDHMSGQMTEFWHAEYERRKAAR